MEAWRLRAITDAIGQVTTLDYDQSAIFYKLRRDRPIWPVLLPSIMRKKVIDWIYGQAAQCPDPIITNQPIHSYWLDFTTDVLGLTSQFTLPGVEYHLFCVAPCPTNGHSIPCQTNSYSSLDFLGSVTTPTGLPPSLRRKGAGRTAPPARWKPCIRMASRDRVNTIKTPARASRIPSPSPRCQRAWQSRTQFSTVETPFSQHPKTNPEKKGGKRGKKEKKKGKRKGKWFWFRP